MSKDDHDIDPLWEIVSSRLLHAGIETVFEAWTNPLHLQKWWGPAGFTNTFHEHDLKPGGTWRFTMHGPEKGHYQNECVFIKIEKPVHLSWYRVSQPVFTVVVNFEKVDDSSTRVVFKMQFASVEECNKLRPHVPGKNEENFDRLENELRLMMGIKSV